ncbi:MAG: DHHW family protein, partial [Acutalibacteraceae bacterium]|nr:DHHW family protein [Acutalibacteraceae bacterium]
MKKIQKILTAVSFSVVLAVFTVVGFYSFFDKDEKVSEMENRNLAQKPSFSASSYFSGDFASKFEEYYNDQFPGRNGLVKISNKIKSFYS